MNTNTITTVVVVVVVGGGGRPKNAYITTRRIKNR